MVNTLLTLGETTVTSGGMENITTGVSAIMEIATTMLTFVTGNPILCALFAVPFIGVAIGVVNKFRRR